MFRIVIMLSHFSMKFYQGDVFEVSESTYSNYHYQGCSHGQLHLSATKSQILRFSGFHLFWNDLKVNRIIMNTYRFIWLLIFTILVISTKILLVPFRTNLFTTVLTTIHYSHGQEKLANLSSVFSRVISYLLSISSWCYTFRSCVGNL